MVRKKNPPPTKQREQLQRWQQEELIRQAEVSYITDPQRRTVNYWWEQNGVGKTTLSQMLDRATKGKWSLRRDQYWDGCTNEVLRRAKFQVVSIRMKELREIQTVRDNLLELVTPDVIKDRKIFKVQPKSLEACMRALVAVSEHQDATRDRVLSMVEPELAGLDAADGPVRTTFEPEEMRKVARMLLEERRQKQIIDVESEEDDEG